MRHTIETAPKDRKFVILEDDASGIYDVAHWSPESAAWIGKDNEPTKLTPTHWHPLVRDEYFPREDEATSNRPAVWTPPWRHRKTLCIGASLAAGFLVVHAIRETVQFDGVRMIGRVVSQTTQLLNQGTRSFLPASLLTGTDQVSPTQVRQVQLAAASQAPQPQKVEQAEAAAQELAEARRTIGQLNLQLREEAAKSLQSLEQERKQSTVLAQEAATARDELAASSLRYRQGLDEERARRTAIESELAATKREIEAQVTQLRKASDEAVELAHAETAKNMQALEQERKQSAVLAQEATAARDKLAASSAEYDRTLDEERARRTALESELATAKSDIEAQATRLRTASDEALNLAQAEAAKNLQSLEQERKQSAAHVQEAGAARGELAASSARYGQALDEERARRAATESELAAAKSEIQTQAMQLQTASDEAVQLAHAVAAQNQQSVDQERKQAAALAREAATARTRIAPELVDFRQALREEGARSAALENELAMARRRIEAEGVRLHGPSNEKELPMQALASTTTELKQSSQQGRGGTAALAQASSPRNAVVAPAAPEAARSSQIPGAAARVPEFVALPQVAIADPQSSPEATRLMARASTLLVQGDIGAVRTVLESAAETGSARASFMLAQTYDPAILAAWGTYGTRGEVGKARELYAKAQAGGIQEAKDRFDALRQ
jgi:hypothetical protein